MGVNDPVYRNDLHFPLHMISVPQKRYCLLCGQDLVSNMEWCAVSFTVNYCVYHIKLGGEYKRQWMPDMVLFCFFPSCKVRELYVGGVESQGSVPSTAETFLFTVQLSLEHTEPSM
jgi:hypothetical protein